MVPLIVVQPVFIDVIQESSDIMPFGPVKTPLFDFPPRFTAFEGLFVLPRFPSDLGPILMVQDILDNIGVVAEVQTLGVMMEGGVHTITSGYMGLWPSHRQNDLLTVQVYSVCIRGNLTEDLCRALPYPVQLGM